VPNSLRSVATRHHTIPLTYRVSIATQTNSETISVLLIIRRECNSLKLADKSDQQTHGMSSLCFAAVRPGCSSYLGKYLFEVPSLRSSPKPRAPIGRIIWATPGNTASLREKAANGLRSYTLILKVDIQLTMFNFLNFLLSAEWSGFEKVIMVQLVA
jgi:hypothetical protein